MKCPKCRSQLIGIEYSYNHPEHYDGISEWLCEKDNLRIGRWSKKYLVEDEYEKRYGGR